MLLVDQRSTDLAFQQKEVREVEIVRRSNKEWYFRFYVENPMNHQLVEYRMKTQRGALKTWSDPRTLFNFLVENYGVLAGKFVLTEETFDEPLHPDSLPARVP